MIISLVYKPLHNLYHGVTGRPRGTRTRPRATTRTELSGGQLTCTVLAVTRTGTLLFSIFADLSSVKRNART